MREIDRLTTGRFAIPSLLLMEQAASAALRLIAAHFQDDLRGVRARIFCGVGNNGGDGAALARLLSMANASVEVILVGRIVDAHGDARTNFEIVERFATEPAAGSGVKLVECASEDTWRAIEDRFRACQPPADALVDALFGTGLTRPATGVHAHVINYINEVRQQRDEQSTRSADTRPTPLVVSLDLPSGFAADAAIAPGAAVTADLTIAFTAPKLTNVMPPASRANGRLAIRSVGTPSSLIEEAASQTYVAEEIDARAWLRRTRYAAGSYKNTHGHVLVIAGSRDMSGAPVLASNAAFAAGAGLVTLATPRSAHHAAAARVRPEVMVAALAEDAEHGTVNAAALRRTRELAGRATVIAIGCGLSAATEETRRFVREIVETRAVPVVIDADGLNALAPLASDFRGTPEAPLILTPHEGEMRRLLGVNAKGNTDEDPLADRITAARRFAVKHALFLVLKGERTLTAAPDGRVCINPTGNPGLGTAGAGDTLTGIIAGFIAQDRASRPGEAADTFASIVAAVYTGGIAGDIAAERKGVRTMMASDIADALPAAVRRLDPEGERP